MDKENDRASNNSDIFYKRDYSFMVQHGINGEFMKVLKEKFNVEQIYYLTKKVKKDGPKETNFDGESGIN